MSTELVPQATISEIVEKRNLALALYDKAYKSAQVASHDLDVAQQSARDAAPTAETYFSSSNSEEIKRFYKTVALPDAELFYRIAKRIIDTNVWSHIIQLTKLESLMDKEEREKLHKQLMTPPPKPNKDGEIIQDNDVDWMPEISEENIAATIQGFMANSNLIFYRGIANVFSKLDRRFRSHDGFKIGSRVIIYQMYDGGSYSYTRDHESTIFDIERTFLILDEKDPTARYASIIQTVRNERDAMRKELRISWGAGFQSEHEGDFFKIRIFKNGNVHLWFKRKDLVQKINKMLGEYYGEVIPDGQVKEADPFTDIKHKPAKNFGYYPTPSRVVTIVTSEFGALYRDEPLLILEPSAGSGNISSAAARNENHIVDVVEIQPELSQQLQKSTLYRRTYHYDFLKLSPDITGLYDRVLMNPPFDRERDIDHVMHAWKFVKPGGRLVAVMSAGTEFRETKKSGAFRKFAIDHKVGRWNNKWCNNLPDGSFSDVGTNVNTIIVALQKPGK